MSRQAISYSGSTIQVNFISQGQTKTHFWLNNLFNLLSCGRWCLAKTLPGQTILCGILKQLTLRRNREIRAFRELCIVRIARSNCECVEFRLRLRSTFEGGLACFPGRSMKPVHGRATKIGTQDRNGCLRRSGSGALSQK
jgi:hypothetical protein